LSVNLTALRHGFEMKDIEAEKVAGGYGPERQPLPEATP
jgi:hypothetical protein